MYTPPYSRRGSFNGDSDMPFLANLGATLAPALFGAAALRMGMRRASEALMYHPQPPPSKRVYRPPDSGLGRAVVSSRDFGSYSRKFKRGSVRRYTRALKRRILKSGVY